MEVISRRRERAESSSPQPGDNYERVDIWIFTACPCKTLVIFIFFCLLLDFPPPPAAPHPPPPPPENGHKQTSLLCCLFSAKPVAVPWALICRRDIYSAVSRPERWKKERQLISFFIFPPLWLPDRHFGWFTGGEARENTAGFFCARFAHVLFHDWRGKHNNCRWWGQAFREKKNASKWYYNRVLIIRLLSEGFPCNQIHCWKVLGRARTVPVPDTELFSSFILQ